MKRLYTDPSIDVSVFDTENIVTESGTAAASVEEINESKYSRVNVGYADLDITRY